MATVAEYKFLDECCHDGLLGKKRFCFSLPPLLYRDHYNRPKSRHRELFDRFQLVNLYTFNLFIMAKGQFLKLMAMDPLFSF